MTRLMTIVVNDPEGTVMRVVMTDSDNSEKRFLEIANEYRSVSDPADNHPNIDSGVFRSITGHTVCMIMPDSDITAADVEVPTYIDAVGHTLPKMEVGIKVGQGITLSLPREVENTHHVVDFGPGPVDETRGIEFTGSEHDCSEWIEKHQQIKDGGAPRYAIQECDSGVVDVYIERIKGAWTVNVSPDGETIETVVKVTDETELFINGVQHN